MIGGASSSQGIMIYDTSLDGDNAVYGYYDQDEIIVIKDTYQQLQHLFKEEDKRYKNHIDDTILYVLIFLLVFICVISFIVFSLKYFLIVLFLSICGFFPLLVLCYAHVNMYNDDEHYHQMRKYHGCEHALVQCLSDHKDISLEELKKTSIYDSECGTVYSGTILLLLIYIAYLMMIDTSFFILLRNVIIAIILMFINLFNPYNPLKIFQYHAVEKPTNKEYLLAMEIMKEFKG